MSPRTTDNRLCSVFWRELVRQREVALIVPRTICDEFARNKARVVEESTRSLSGVLKRVKDVVDRFGDARRKRTVLDQLNDVDHRLPILGESAIDSIARIEKRLARSPIIETTDAVKLRAAQRAIDRRAPFHRQRNGIDDAVLIETYADTLTAREPGTRFAFVTHNTKDFSHPTGNDKLSHPDMASCFLSNQVAVFRQPRRSAPAGKSRSSLLIS